MVKPERGLGRGLDALLSSSLNDDYLSENEIEIDKIKPGVNQPRKHFDEIGLKELADSIKEHGLLQPVLVRPVDDGEYEIVAGERRWRAARIAGLESIPVVIKDMEDNEAAEISLVENIQRDDLTVIEEAWAYKNMIERYNYTQEGLSERIGKSRSHIANCLRILTLPDEILELITRGDISAGHARALLSLSSDEERIKMARQILSGKLSVRQLERRVKARKNKTAKAKPAEVLDIEEKLEDYFGTRIEIISRRKGGKIEISYYNDEELERLIELLGVK